MAKDASMSSKQNKKGGKSQRTVDVSADGGPPLSMTPEAAARYLQQATSNNAKREVKISFGPSRPPSLETLKETAAREGLPCTEAEMKALMGMFVEIMGMGPDGKSPAVDGGVNGKAGPMSMMFGQNGTNGANWPDQESLAAAAAGLFADGASWDAIRRTYGAMQEGMDKQSVDYEDDEDYDSIPDLDEIPSMDLKQAMAARDWEALGRMAAEDTLEAQDRARKAAKNREKKQRRRQKAKEEAEMKLAEETRKLRELEIVSWRDMVVSACQSQDIGELDNLIDESPFIDDDEDDNDILPHLEFLLPYTLAKSRNHVETGKEIRCKLASYLLDEELHLAFEPMQNGRPILHAACFLGDLALVELVLDKLEHYFQAHANDKHPFLAREDLDITCADVGWAALHYATMSGSAKVLEVLLRSGCNAKAITDSILTRNKRSGRGITAVDLIECIKNETYDKELEWRGNAIDDIRKIFFESPNEKKGFLKSLENAAKRVNDVEINGYIVPGLLGDLGDPPGAAKKRKKKKKKKKQGATDPETTKEVNPSPSPKKASVPISAAKEAPPEEFDDPLVTALLGMGFAKDQILSAIKACGGSNHATADDLVTWILGQDTSADDMTHSGNFSQQPISGNQGPGNGDDEKVSKSKILEDNRRAVEEKQRQDEAAKRLAEKREEQRRRNREWNNREQARQQQAKVQMAQKVSTLPPGLSVRNIPGPTLQTGLARPPLPAGAKNYVSQPSVSSLPASLKAPVPLKLTPSAGTAKSIPSVGGETDFPSLAKTVPKPSNQQPRKTRPSPPISTAPNMNASNSFPPIGDDDRTVSSFGSNRGLSVSSAPFVPPGMKDPTPPPSISHAPPGFWKPPTAVRQHSGDSDIRATASEYQPMKTLTGSTSVQQTMATNPPGFSNGFGFGASLGPPATQQNALHSASGVAPLSQGFLGGIGSSSGSSYLGSVPVSYNGVSQSASVPVSSVGSVLAGLPGFDDGSALPSVSGTSYGLGFDSQPQQPSGASSLLSSSFTSQPVASDSLWGAPAPPQGATPSLAGLPPLTFGSNISQDSSDDKNSLSQKWAPPSNGGGSIW